MKKVIGILYNSNFNESSFETGCGGSETWVIQISKEFIKRGLIFKIVPTFLFKKVVNIFGFR